jgi:hypothetical protein
MILWIFPLIACAGVLLAGFAWAHTRAPDATPTLTLIPVRDADVTGAGRTRVASPGPQVGR